MGKAYKELKMKTPKKNSCTKIDNFIFYKMLAHLYFGKILSVQNIKSKNNYNIWCMIKVKCFYQAPKIFEKFQKIIIHGFVDSKNVVSIVFLGDKCIPYGLDNIQVLSSVFDFKNVKRVEDTENSISTDKSDYKLNSSPWLENMKQVLNLDFISTTRGFKAHNVEITSRFFDLDSFHQNFLVQS